ncbi:MAG: hypothetical protein H7257_07830 [Taibaiella sp.]|nr:hypothetical protein [Taibaiella sp.]
MKKIYILGAFACLFAACKPSVNITVPSTAGDAVFTNYLAIGNSLTAGYADGSLYVTGQLNSYPQRLFEQFSMIKDRGARGPFYQPLLNGDMGFGPGSTGTGNNRPRKVIGYTFNCLGDTSIGPVDLPYYSADADDAKAYTSPNRQVNNIGVPGIRVSDYLVSFYASLNPYAGRFYYSASETPLDELLFRVNNLHPTFFTMWLGSNDVLGYALAGGQGDGSGNAGPGAFGLYNSADITPTSVFKMNYDTAVAVASSVGAKGALINIPDITSIPFFTTIPSNGLYIPRQSLADSLTQFYRSLNYVFSLGYNQFIIRDNVGALRQSVPGELILITTPHDSLTCAGWGSFKAIPEQYVITTDELQNIRNATTRYNEIIRSAAERNLLAYVDMFSYMSTLQSGIVYHGVNYNASFISGGAFSLDAVHLTPRGYAIVANKIISTINEKYHSTVTPVDVNKFHGVLFP